jgi:hypothetical protein
MHTLHIYRYLCIHIYPCAPPDNPAGQEDRLWRIEPSDLAFPQPEEVLGSGARGVIIKARCDSSESGTGLGRRERIALFLVRLASLMRFECLDHGACQLFFGALLVYGRCNDWENGTQACHRALSRSSTGKRVGPGQVSWDVGGGEAPPEPIRAL